MATFSANEKGSVVEIMGGSQGGVWVCSVSFTAIFS